MPDPLSRSVTPASMTASRPSHPAFSPAWASAWRAHLNDSPEYREAAGDWEGDVVLEMAEEDGGSGRAVYLDLWRGACRAARVATTADLEAARFLLRGPRRAWEQVLSGQLAPVMAVLTGRLRLARGSLAELMPYAAAARAMLAAPAAFDTVFLED